ncbi:HNH endonuclease signature motif containing protein [Arthrobacter sp. ZGTC212]|uniref:HNH endonuclease signature motif containing protein n=1 Tax=Arthrobacter sp. ZGTC212 TaxID=2058899 RepID=UPI000CE48595|nr:HNH endonuclease signature motif containing protein [Arthrobacter sp. ZGTC212]
MEEDLKVRTTGAASAAPEDQAQTWSGPGETHPSFSAGQASQPIPALSSLVPAAQRIVRDLDERIPFLSSAELVTVASDVESLSRLVDHLQIVAAAALERARISSVAADSWTLPSGKDQQEFKNTAEYLRHRLRISRREAWRRVRLGSSLTSSTNISGETLEPELPVVAEWAGQGLLAGEAAQVISMAMKRVQGCGTCEDRAAMEAALTDVAASQDQDVLNVVAQAWINHLDPDGTEPSEQQKAELQGLFIRRRYRGLHRIDIFATEDQFETLMTALAPEANPRVDAAKTAEGSCVDLEGKPRAVPADPRSYPQKRLDGLVSSCRLALLSGRLPASGGSKPQVLAVIAYDQLSDRLTTAGAGSSKAAGTNPDRTPESGMLAFAGPVPARQIRRIACDADIIPVVLSGEGRVLDVGSAARYFPPHLRKALIARDRGCAFPGCTAPAPWCEAHHIEYHSHGGATSTDNGVLLCGFHHHLIHREKWRVGVRRGVPWFVPPTYVDPYQAPLRNTYFHPLRPPRSSA